MGKQKDNLEGLEVQEDLDIHDPDFVINPYPIYSWLRDHRPLFYCRKHGGFWLLTRYDDVAQAVKDWRTFTSSVVGVTAIPIITPRTEPQLPIELDPPQHSRYRSLVNPAFSISHMNELRPKIAKIAIRLIDRLLQRGGGDLVIDYAVPLSVETLAVFAGLPKDDCNIWIEWIRRMFDVQNPIGRDRAGVELSEYVDRLIVERKKNPRNDFISLLLKSEIDGRRLTDRELQSFTVLLFGAGFETTTDALSIMLHYLALNAADRNLVTTIPQVIPSAVEEFLRFSSPVQIFGRNATKDLQMYGETIRAGEVVALSYASANHDPTVFPNPERCNFERNPNRHMAFGAGPHLCLGAPVARLEMAVTLEEFIQRIPNFILAPDIEVMWKRRGDRRGLENLPIQIL